MLNRTFPCLLEVQRLKFGLSDLLVVSALEKGQFGVVGLSRSTGMMLDGR